MNIQYGWVVNGTCNHLQGHHKMICFMFNHELKRLNLESAMEWSMWKGVNLRWHTLVLEGLYWPKNIIYIFSCVCVCVCVSLT
jgi:hypothetical protein